VSSTLTFFIESGCLCDSISSLDRPKNFTARQYPWLQAFLESGTDDLWRIH